MNSQSPLSDTHDELLFIIIHQASELWIKPSLHELEAARRNMADDRLGAAFKMTSRGPYPAAAAADPEPGGAGDDHTGRLYRHARQAGRQVRLPVGAVRQLEYMFGHKNADMLAAHESDAAAQATLSRALARTSIYDETLRLFARRGFPVPDDRLE